MSFNYKYLVNPNDFKFTFQHGGQIYEVPPVSEILLPAEVADHGERRSMSLSDPVFNNESGELVSSGNAVVKYCRTREASGVSPVGRSAPIVLENSPDKVSSVEELKVENNLNGLRHVPPKATFRQGDMPKTTNPMNRPVETKVSKEAPDANSAPKSGNPGLSL